MKTQLYPGQLAEAEILGIGAYGKGLKCAPILDTRFTNLPHWAAEAMLRAWLRGWHTANRISALQGRDSSNP